MSGWSWKGTVGFTEIVKNHGMNLGTAFQIVRLFPIFSETKHKSLKSFSKNGLMQRKLGVLYKK